MREKTASEPLGGTEQDVLDQRYGRVKKLFAELVELDPEARGERLREIDGEDMALAEEVASLLEADEDPSAPLLEPVHIETHLGPYRLIRQLGAGGMGEVFLAEQSAPVRRQVALKLVRSGLDSQEVLTRFEGERQALALMAHPAIASVYDAGTAADGRPYFVMEYAAGVPITTYCDDKGLAPRERIELFRQICDGIQHAHLKGVIHRDLKPSNLLVVERDGEAQVKIIDFGIAKATAKATALRLTEQTLYTELGRVVGTPEYMSPEQASPKPFDIDLRTDVYSLGVVLYELLVGVRPFEAQPGASGFEEMRRRLNDEDPPRPSARASGLASQRPELAEKRRLASTAWVRRLRGDLDWITLKALERSRERRYQSAAALADDLGRALAHQPVQAGPPSVIYRAGKFVRRHRGVVTAATLAALALLVGAVGVLLSLDRALRAERRALAEATAMTQVSEFLVDTFRLADPIRGPDEAVSTSDLLDRGLERLATELEEQPLVRARLLDTFGQIYYNLGRLEKAEIYTEAIALLEKEEGLSSPQLAVSLGNLGTLRASQERYQEAEELTRRALEIQAGASDPEEVAQRVTNLSNLATVLINLERFDEAEGILRQAVAVRTELSGPEDWSLAQLYNNLGMISYERGDYAAAADGFEQALVLARSHFDGDHPWIASMLNNIGGLYWTLERFDQAAPYLREAAAIRQKALPPDHPDVAMSLSNLAEVETQLQNYPAAETLLNDARRIQEQIDAVGFERAHVSMGFGRLYRQLGRLEESIDHFRTALELRMGSGGAENQYVGEAWQELAESLELAGRSSEAEEARRHSEEIGARGSGAAAKEAREEAAGEADPEVKEPARSVDSSTSG